MLTHALLSLDSSKKKPHTSALSQQTSWVQSFPAPLLNSAWVHGHSGIFCLSFPNTPSTVSGLLPVSCMMIKLAAPQATSEASTNAKRPAAVTILRKKARICNPTDFVTLIAGDGETAKEFGVHKDFACHYSPVLKAAFHSSFVEGRTQVYKLPEYDEDIVKLLVHWLYTQELIADSLEEPELASSELLSFCKLWILADSLLVPSLQNAAMDMLIQVQDTLKKTATSCLVYVYQNTNPESPLRKMLLHRCICFLSPRKFASCTHQFPKEMLIELASITCDIKNHNALVVQTGTRSNPSQYRVVEEPETDVKTGSGF
ncbi:hypothetical protein VTL71DRAFT_12099 [Oculimacula yallundae]|uniref:BTB domain-containing protein n=1 Tax=Oculimacula yallundae TaxID=86028 RepID=A0ABR4CTK5_9HELO